MAGQCWCRRGCLVVVVTGGVNKRLTATCDVTYPQTHTHTQNGVTSHCSGAWFRRELARSRRITVGPRRFNNDC